MPKKKAKPPAPMRLIDRRHYATLWVAANQALTLLQNMEEAGAIRLPFIGFQQTVDNLRQAVAVPASR